MGSGGPAGIRTRGLSGASRALFQAELPAHRGVRDLPGRVMKVTLVVVLAAGLLAVLAFLGGGTGSGLTPAEEAVFDELVRLRMEQGVPAPRLVSIGFARERALDMAGSGYFGHCRPDGSWPIESYRGVHYVEENIAVVYPGPGSSVEDAVKEAVRAMVYDDEEYGWKHRDSLLDPLNNAVEVAVAEAGGAVYVVVEMYKAWVDWERASYASGTLTLEGVLRLEDSRILGLAVYRIEEPRVMAWPSKRGIVYTCLRAPEGEIVAVLLARGDAPEGVGVLEGSIEARGSWFRVTASYEPPAGEGFLYYAVLWVEAGDGAASYPFGERYGGDVPVALIPLGVGG